MRERVADHRLRTGRPYAPRGAVPGARPLADDEACPTLFRYPGPEALLEQLARAPVALAPPGAEVLWLAERPLLEAPAAVASFGTLVVLEPLALSPQIVEGSPGLWVATPGDPGEVVWLPPSRAGEDPARWDAVRTAADARALLGDVDDERALVMERLGSYVEELALLAAAGVPAPAGAWIDLPLEERARILGARGLAGIFSR
jgi:hypothetical protein